ncbi:MAG: hypothetical protein N3H31_06025 [Candidatus Nezhaarchaeota archaeon]|nr:hypothetical protein [Candidatus Nezhaarchaeota archaeon]
MSVPYIKPEKRPGLDRIIEQIVKHFEEVEDKDRDGQLSYLFTKTLKSLYRPSYFNYERIIGLLECIQHEFYRRWVGPYEDAKMKENGDI